MYVCMCVCACVYVCVYENGAGAEATLALRPLTDLLGRNKQRGSTFLTH
jgi:hypothetical protein